MGFGGQLALSSCLPIIHLPQGSLDVGPVHHLHQWVRKRSQSWRRYDLQCWYLRTSTIQIGHQIFPLSYLLPSGINNIVVFIVTFRIVSICSWNFLLNLISSRMSSAKSFQYRQTFRQTFSDCSSSRPVGGAFYFPCALSNRQANVSLRSLTHNSFWQVDRKAANEVSVAANSGLGFGGPWHDAESRLLWVTVWGFGQRIKTRWCSLQSL